MVATDVEYEHRPIWSDGEIAELPECRVRRIPAVAPGLRIGRAATGDLFDPAGIGAPAAQPDTAHDGIAGGARVPQVEPPAILVESQRPNRADRCCRGRSRITQPVAADDVSDDAARVDREHDGPRGVPSAEVERPVRGDGERGV